MFDILKQKPFSLSETQLAQVQETFASLGPRDKVAQLFTLLLLGNDQQDIQQVLDNKPGGITRFFSDDLAYEHQLISDIIASSDVPPLFSADLEGSHQSLHFGTQTPGQLAVSAINDTAFTKEVAALSAREAKSMGVTWSFTPVVDINQAFRSSIVGSRSYGSDVERINRHALAHIEGMQSQGVANAIKHWPGEGFDDRDQHLVTTVNPLGIEEWRATFGALYQSAVDAGVMSVMSAHISLPAYMRAKYPDCGRDAFLPASINPVLNIDLLRGELGFNGVIVSDATEMAGLASWYPEPEVIVRVLEAGCDMILFSRHPKRDMDAILDAVESGRLPQSRIDEALVRVLGLKAKSGLLSGDWTLPALAQGQVKIAPQSDQDYVNAMVARAPVLEKNLTDDLPLSPQKHQRVLVITTDIVHPIMAEPPQFSIPEWLQEAGFDVTVYTPELEWEPTDYDAVLYLLGDESLLTKGRIFINWAKIGGGIGKAMIRPWTEVPTVMVSFGHPYHLYDAPQAPVYINAWNTTEQSQRAVFHCLLGVTSFNTQPSPVDAFCGMESLRY